MSPQQIEQALRTLSTTGRLVRTEPQREVWRVELAGRSWDVRFYPRNTSAGLALRDFSLMQSLQRVRIPAPRVIAQLAGFLLDARIGDAVIVEPTDDLVPLSSVIEAGMTPRRRHAVVRQLVEMLGKLREADVAIANGSPDTFAFRGNALMIAPRDPTDLGRGRMTMQQVFTLAANFDSLASRTERLRAWRAMVPIGPLPPRNPVLASRWKAWSRDAAGLTPRFDTFTRDGFRGIVPTHRAFPRPWSLASRLPVGIDDWQREWPNLLARLRSDQLDVLKSEPSGDVLAGEVVLAGRPVKVVVKQPKRKQAIRAALEFGGFARAARTWAKAWKLLPRSLPTEVPLLLIERQSLGFVREAYLVFEFVPGTVLARLPLGSLSPADRRTLLHRCGSTLRRIESLGFTHFDAKTHNWIVHPDPVRGPTPVLIDLDGIRHYRWRGAGIERFVRALRTMPDASEADRVHAVRGYAPFATLDVIAGLAGVPRDDALAIERRPA